MIPSLALRLITSNLVDAFPELDEFPPAQRLAFLNRAMRRWWVIVLPLVFAAIALIIAFIASVTLINYIERTIDSFQSPSGMVVNSVVLIDLMIVVAPLCVGGFVFLLTRDLLCRRRIGQIIRLRFNCSACRYKLAGLAISDDCKATCPECGLVQSVDPSLRELVKSQPTD